MAKKSKIVKNDQRRAIVERYAERRAMLKKIIRSPASTPEQRLAAQQALAPASRRQRGAGAQPRRGRRSSARAPAQVRIVPGAGARAGASGATTRHPQSELVDGRQIDTPSPARSTSANGEKEEPAG